MEKKNGPKVRMPVLSKQPTRKKGEPIRRKLERLQERIDKKRAEVALLERQCDGLRIQLSAVMTRPEAQKRIPGV